MVAHLVGKKNRYVLRNEWDILIEIDVDYVAEMMLNFDDLFTLYYCEDTTCVLTRCVIPPIAIIRVYRREPYVLLYRRSKFAFSVGDKPMHICKWATLDNEKQRRYQAYAFTAKYGKMVCDPDRLPTLDQYPQLLWDVRCPSCAKRVVMPDGMIRCMRCDMMLDPDEYLSKLAGSEHREARGKERASTPSGRSDTSWDAISHGGTVRPASALAGGATALPADASAGSASAAEPTTRERKAAKKAYKRSADSVKVGPASAEWQRQGVKFIVKMKRQKAAQMVKNGKQYWIVSENRYASGHWDRYDKDTVYRNAKRKLRHPRDIFVPRLLDAKSGKVDEKDLVLYERDDPAGGHSWRAPSIEDYIGDSGSGETGDDLATEAGTTLSAADTSIADLDGMLPADEDKKKIIEVSDDEWEKAPADPRHLSVRELKALAQGFGIDPKGCLEKAELLKLLEDKVGSLAKIKTGPDSVKTDVESDTRKTSSGPTMSPAEWHASSSAAKRYERDRDPSTKGSWVPGAPWKGKGDEKGTKGRGPEDPRDQTARGRPSASPARKTVDAMHLEPAVKPHPPMPEKGRGKGVPCWAASVGKPKPPAPPLPEHIRLEEERRRKAEAERLKPSAPKPPPPHLPKCTRCGRDGHVKNDCSAHIDSSTTLRDSRGRLCFPAARTTFDTFGDRVLREREREAASGRGCSSGDVPDPVLSAEARREDAAAWAQLAARFRTHGPVERSSAGRTEWF